MPDILSELAEPPRIPSDGTPAFLCDRPKKKLHTACAQLAGEISNKELDLVTWRRIQGMMGLLNLYLDKDLNLSWRKVSVIISKSQRHGNAHSPLMHSRVDSLQ